MKKNKNALLWRIYSNFYDSLNYFTPYKRLMSELVDVANLDADENVLDLGAGTGNIIKYIEEPEVNLICVDYSEYMLSKARKKCSKCKFYKLDINTDKLPMPSNSMDKVISNNVIYNVEDLGKLFKEINRVLVRNGTFTFSNSIKNNTWPIIKEHLLLSSFIDHVKFFLHSPQFVAIMIINIFIDKSGKFYFHKEAEIVDALKSNGFKVTSSEPCYGGVNIMIAAEKITGK